MLLKYAKHAEPDSSSNTCPVRECHGTLNDRGSSIPRLTTVQFSIIQPLCYIRHRYHRTSSLWSRSVMLSKGELGRYVHWFVRQYSAGVIVASHSTASVIRGSIVRVNCVGCRTSPCVSRYQQLSMSRSISSPSHMRT
jgi:hypothetical protein